MNMRIEIDFDLCQGHGICAEEAPSVFRVIERPGGYDRVELILESPQEALRDRVEAAVRYCPNRVLRLVDARREIERQATPSTSRGTEGRGG